MSSSESASSDEEKRPAPAPATSDSDSDSDTGGPTTQKRGGRSDSSGSGSDVEKPQAKPAKKKVLTKRKRKASGSSDDDQVDDSLFTDKEDKARWKGLSELEKEREIFERMEARESARAREEIAQQLAKKAKKNTEKGAKTEKRRKMNSDGGSPKAKGSSDSDSEMDAEFHHPSEINRKHKEKNAMDALKHKRKEIEKKNAKNAALSIDAVFGANSGSSSSSSSSESSRSSSSSRESSPERNADQEKVVKKEVETLAELRKARLSRHKLALMIHAPFFDSTVVGCYVRLGQGMISGSQSKYRIWKIIGVEQTNKVYDLEGKKTNKSIKCQFGRSERPFRMQFVSNSEFEQVEFDEWRNATKAQGSVPTVDIMEKKHSDIEKAINHKYSDKEVDLMIKEKSKFQKVTRNFAMTKAGLSKQKELAQQRGDIREAERVQKEIDEIERHADELDKERSKSIRAIAFINHRNRTQIKDQVLSGKLKIEESSQDDPFTRKKGGMRVVSGSKSKLDGKPSAASSNNNLSEAGKDAPSSAPKSTLPPPAKPMGMKKPPVMSSLHDFDLDIDLDKLKNVGEEQAARRAVIGGAAARAATNRPGNTVPSTSSSAI
ncbi:hypothetical protein GCK72_017133 [Caenorhabditis remanei]|uniref:Plus3 domain-containing protein n=1 Tax=Caenorhabditis remanei TaxID=31234 RepID=A0A6A5G7A6_CAERE|nr:hypothetical protein GCK72_017133 [Caenorhabditis remanei]KAF1750582.1 hypothetical protein GCK72_017133 [Caenorhabditis remanei]